MEIVSIDAMQVYRGMDIGTAKATIEERARVRHHMLDLVEATETFTVAQFQAEFRSVRADMERREAFPLLVGGTGLYLRAVVDDLDIPGTWPDVRARLESEALVSGPEVLHDRLQAVDPAAALKMERTNTRRIVRALEVVEGSGRAFSSFGPGVDEYPPTDVRQVALRWDRDVLRGRVAERVRTMVGDGLVEEVRGLLETGISRTARQALGYKEMIDVVEGRASLAEAIDSIVLRTCQFAVRQERWFRRDPRVTWFEIRNDPVGEVAPRIIDMLA